MGLRKRTKKTPALAAAADPVEGLADAGELLALEALDQTGLAITSEGAFVRILEVRPPNPLILSDQDCIAMSRMHAAMLSRLRPQQTVQFYVQARPINLDEVLATSRHEVSHWAGPAPARGDRLDGVDLSRWRLFGAMEDSLRRHADDQAAMRLTAHVIVPYVPRGHETQKLLSELRPGRGFKLPTAPMERLLPEHRRAVRESLAHTEQIRGSLEAMGIPTRMINGAEVAHLIWQRFNPTLADAGRLPSTPLTEVLGELDTVTDLEDAQHAAVRLREALCESHLDFKSSPHYAEIDRDLEQIVYVENTAETTYMGWLYCAMMAREPFALSVYVHGLDRASERGSIKRNYRQTFAINRGAEAKGRVPDFDRYAKEDETRELLQEFAGSSRASVYKVSIYLSTRSRGPAPDVSALTEAVDHSVNQIRQTADCKVHRGRDMQEVLWQTMIPLGRDVAARVRKYATRNIGDMVPLVGAQCGSPSGIPFAFSEPDRTLELLNPYDRAHSNQTLLICGKGGSGKTNTANIILSRSIAHGARGFVIDRAGHFQVLVDLIDGARHIDIGADDSPWAINPWDLPEGGADTREKVTFLLSLHSVMMGEEGLTNTERAYLGPAIRAVYARAQMLDEQPRESMLRDELLARAREEADTGAHDVARALRSLADRLGEFCGDGAYAYLLDRETNVPGDAPLVVFDTRRCPAEVLQPVMFATTEYITRKVEAHRDVNAALSSRPDAPMFAGKSILTIDECWHLLARQETGQYANDLARRARHLGLLLMPMSQQLSDFDSEHGRALVRNATQFVILEQHPEEIPHIRDSVRLTEQETEIVGQLRTIKGPGGYAQAFWINGSRGRGKVAIRVGPLEYWAFTSDPINDVPRRKAAIAAHGGDVWAGIAALARDPDALAQAA
jgi:hypothetical protein